MAEGDEFELPVTVFKLSDDNIILEFTTARRMIVCGPGTVTFSSDLVPPENLIRDDARLGVW